MITPINNAAGQTFIRPEQVALIAKPDIDEKTRLPIGKKDCLRAIFARLPNKDFLNSPITKTLGQRDCSILLWVGIGKEFLHMPVFMRRQIGKQTAGNCCVKK